MRIPRPGSALVLCGFAFSLAAQPHRRAVLIGIDDYTASHLRQTGSAPAFDRDWPSLGGAVNDVRTMGGMLVRLYGFDRRDIVTLTDQAATRAAILRAIDAQLVQPAAKGDVLLFYYSGHGSQVRNSRSDEPDKLDESIVPADSRLGPRDIRDKELRRLFNRMLDRGARLTVILDSCHSGSGARGLPTGAVPRGVKFDPRDVADGSDGGPRPEQRGALVLSAAEDIGVAWETHGDDGQLHGAFSWAWVRAMRDAVAGEPARDTFQRAQARLHAETPYQDPVLAGTAEALRRPFLGVRTDRTKDRALIPVESVRPDGTVVLQAGWANGLEAGSELIAAEGTGRLTVTAVHGLGESEARFDPSTERAARTTVRPGALVEVVGWALPSSPPMRVWMPRASGSAKDIMAQAKLLREAATRDGLRWIDDPVESTPKHLLRWRAGQWELLGDGGSLRRFGANGAFEALATIPRRSSVFVQFPAPARLIERIAGAAGDRRIALDATERSEEADYILTGRFAGGQLEYAWVRPAVQRSDRRHSGLPIRSEWQAAGGATAAGAVLRKRVETLRKIRSWNLLTSPSGERWPYRLALRRAGDGARLRDGRMAGGEQYRLSLRIAADVPAARIHPRYVYIFMIDSFGKSVLLFPRDAGSVENRLPLLPAPGSSAAFPPAEIPLDDTARFEVTPPYGVDTYFLLTTDERLPNPGIVEWDGVRARAASTPLEELLALTTSCVRAAAPLTPQSWSIERVVCESIPRRPRRRARSPSNTPCSMSYAPRIRERWSQRPGRPS